MQTQNKMNAKHFSIEKHIFKHPHNMPAGHMHPWHELYYLLEGERRYFINGQIYTVHEGDIIIIPHTTLHHTTAISSRQHTRYLLEFDDAFIHENIQEKLKSCFTTHHITLTHEQRKSFEHVLQKIDAEQQADSEFKDVLFHAYLNELLVMLIRIFKTDTPTATKPKTATEQLIETATNFIGRNLHNTITLTQIADNYHLSHSYFSRIFKSYTGFGFNEYLTHLRIQKATQLLLSSNMPISEISFQCGFSDSNYFSTVFKKEVGLSPIKYRMLQK